MNALYELLPRVHRQRDAENGSVLQALLAVVEEQRTVLTDAVAHLYDDWFVETCAEDLVPYIGALVGYQLLHGYEEELASGDDAAGRVLRAIAPRADVANTIANRRRKGTLSLLEDLATDVAAWPSRAVEFRERLALTQPVRLYTGSAHDLEHRLRRGRMVDLHDVDALDRADGPFDELAHTVDVRRITSTRGVGHYGIDAVGVNIWRLGSYHITAAPAWCDDRQRGHFTFSVLGNDTPLAVAPLREPNASHIADETNVPTFIRRLAFEERTAEYYGPRKSLCLWVVEKDGPALIPLERIVAADLSGWANIPPRGKVAVDPVLGRIAFAPRQSPSHGLIVSYRYAFPADIGGGEYPRCPTPPAAAIYRVGPTEQNPTITAALTQWATEKAADDAKREAVIELVGSEVFDEQITIAVDAGDRLTLRAASGSRPVIRIVDRQVGESDSFHIVGTGAGDGPLPRVVLDGLLIAGRDLTIEGSIAQVALCDCTLVPGWSLDSDCCCRHPDKPSIQVINSTCCIEIDRSIVGSIIVVGDEIHDEPSLVYVSNSIVDACNDDDDALAGGDATAADVTLSMHNTTVFGRLHTHAVGVIENCIITGRLDVMWRQTGCVRFCWVPPDSRLPRHFHCEPELSGDALRVVPRFTSQQYGTPAYGQLHRQCPPEISRGAEDGSALGAYHDLYEPLRLDNLALRLNEYTPAGCDAGVIIVT